MNNIKGSLILLLAAFIWGTAFVAQTSGAGAVGTFTFNAARSIVGALFLAVVIVIKNVLDKRNNFGKVINTENNSRLQTWPLGADNRHFCGRMCCRNVSFMYVWWCIRNISWRCPCVSGCNMLYNTHSGY